MGEEEEDLYGNLTVGPADADAGVLEDPSTDDIEQAVDDSEQAGGDIDGVFAPSTPPRPSSEAPAEANDEAVLLLMEILERNSMRIKGFEKRQNFDIVEGVQ